jgi:hypothetical protein
MLYVRLFTTGTPHALFDADLSPSCHRSKAMNQNIPHKPHTQPDPKTRPDVRKVKAMLREIAFVLKMTQRVREEMTASPGVRYSEPLGC